MDVIDLLKQDHQKVLDELSSIEKNGAPRELGRKSEQLMQDLTRHAAMEEELIYPVLVERDGELEPKVMHALEQHHVMKVLLAEIDELGVRHARFLPKVKLLHDLFQTHVQTEESLLLPKLAESMPEADRDRLGERLREMEEKLMKGERVRPKRAAPKRAAPKRARPTAGRKQAPRRQAAKTARGRTKRTKGR